MTTNNKTDTERTGDVPTLKTLEQLQNDVADWMIEHGPDGHCDGADIIANLIYSKYIIQHNQATADVLCALLDKKKIVLPVGITLDEDEEARNKALTLAQDIIRATLSNEDL